jgi:nitrous oxide reductase accessory protein NosL
MSNDKTTKAAPTHRIYSVSKNGEKTNWTEIGAAWPHKDKQGFNLTFSARPLEGAEIVLRVAKKAEAKSKAKTSRGTLGRYDELNTADNGGAQ